MSHRELVMVAFDNFFTGRNLEGKTVLDVGCRGFEMREKFKEKGLTWTGVDITPRAVHGHLHKGDMNDLPFSDSSFDLVFVCHSLEHNETPIKALREFKRVVKPDGWVFIATPSPCEHQILKADPDHIMVVTPMQMKRWFYWVGIKEVEIYLQTEGINREQDYNVIAIGEKQWLTP